MAASRILLPCMPALDSNGRPVSGALLNFYENNTTTRKAVYTTADLNVELSNPVVADAAGAFPSIFADTDELYSVTCFSPAGVMLPRASYSSVQATSGMQIVADADALPEAFDGQSVYIEDEGVYADANENRWQRRIIRNYLEDFGAKQGDTSAVATQNRNALLAATAAGIRPTLRENGTYAFTQQVALAANTGLIGETNSELVMLGSGFTNTITDAEGAGGSTGCMLDVSGGTSGAFTPKDGIILEGFRIRYSGVDGRNVMGVRAINNTNLRVSGLEICDFPMGFGIHLESQQGIWGVQDCRIHDFYTNIDLGSGSQSTGILIGDSPVNSIDSVGGVIRNIDIDSITFGPVPYAARGEQTDGLNVQQYSRGLQASDLRINRVGEAIDCFADNLTCYNLQCEEIRGAAIKLIHGAHNCHFRGGHVYKYGLWGIVISGTTTIARDTSYNTIEGFDVLGPGDFEGIWSAGNTPAALAFVSPGGALGLPTDNVVRNCRLDGTGAEFAAVAADVNLRNSIVNCPTVTGSVGDVHLTYAGGATYLSPRRTRVQATKSAVQAVSAGATVTVTFPTEVMDTNSEYATGTSVYTANKPRVLGIQVDVRLTDATAGSIFTLSVLKNGVAIKSTILNASATTDIPIFVACEVDVVATDTIEVKFTNGDSVSRTISNNVETTRLRISETAPIG